MVSRVVPPDELIPTCHALAQDMLSCVPEALRGYKRVIDEGFATTFAEGLALEAKASRENAKELSAEEIARRRKSIQERGRGQSRS